MIDGEEARRDELLAATKRSALMAWVIVNER